VGGNTSLGNPVENLLDPVHLRLDSLHRLSQHLKFRAFHGVLPAGYTRYLIFDPLLEPYHDDEYSDTTSHTPPGALRDRWRLEFRTRKEIDREKYALKVLRGDFRDLHLSAGGSPADRVEAALRAADAWNG